MSMQHNLKFTPLYLHCLQVLILFINFITAPELEDSFHLSTDCCTIVHCSILIDALVSIDMKRALVVGSLSDGDHHS